MNELKYVQYPLTPRYGQSIHTPLSLFECLDPTLAASSRYRYYPFSGRDKVQHAWQVVLKQLGVTMAHDSCVRYPSLLHRWRHIMLTSLHDPYLYR